MDRGDTGGRPVRRGLRPPPFEQALTELTNAPAIGIDMPIGLPHGGERRPADQEARDFVDNRRSSVFFTPSAEVLGRATLSEANALARKHGWPGITAQAFALKDKIQDVEPLAAADGRIWEVHPEVSFAEADGGPLEWSKSCWNGVALRRGILADQGIVLPDDLGPGLPWLRGARRIGLSYSRSAFWTNRLCWSAGDPMTTTSIRQQLLDRLSPGGPDRFWTVRDFSDLGADPQSVDRAFLRLVDAGELRRVRRGLYWRGRKSRFGMTWPDDLTLARRIADVPGVGPAGLLAANVLGLSTQVPGMPSFAVPRRAPRSPSSFRFVDRAGRRGRATQRLNPVEVAVLEVLGDWDRVVELPRDRAVSLVRQQVADGTVRPDRLAMSAVSEPASVRTMLDDVFGHDFGRSGSGLAPSLIDV